MSSATPRPTERVLREVLDALDLGVIVCDLALEDVRYVNREGERVLAALRGARGRLPAALRRALVTSVAGAVPAARFSRGVAVAAPGGARYYARVRRVPGRRNAALVVVTAACVRREDRVALLRRRFGVSRVHAECAALACDGLRNQDIARRLGLTEGSVEQYLVVLYETLGVVRRSELVELIDDVSWEAGAEAGSHAPDRDPE